VESKSAEKTTKENMKIIEISAEQYPGSIAQRSVPCTVRGQTRANGDVEIVRTASDTDTLLTVIPKEKRAELAEFLAHAQ
jgi:hypothetical protein